MQNCAAMSQNCAAMSCRTIVMWNLIDRSKDAKRSEADQKNKGPKEARPVKKDQQKQISDRGSRVRGRASIGVIAF